MERIVAGPVIVTFNSLQIGYSRDGVQIRFEPRWIDVPSDEYGGASGAPSDAQLVGAIATVSADLTKYDKAEVRKLTSFQGTVGVAGTLPAFGTLMRQDTKVQILYLNGANEDFTFAKSFVRQAIEVNKGTRFSSAMMAWECWIDAPATRVLFTVT